ncbi:MAG: hypothetical protein G01um10145_21 [Microgenomates group bacterium Gr01-1014_5]|nr:MAG: hypothetical protein G01um10145_21 [Microgenomates group bacterium Gr01-1014_5]
MYGIYMYQHEKSRYLERLFGHDIVDVLPYYEDEVEGAAKLLGLGAEVDHSLFQPELVAQFVARVPVEDIHHAAYFPESNRLILSAPNTFFFPRGWEMNGRIESLPEYLTGDCNFVLGMTATIKENGWKIFDNIGLGYTVVEVESATDGLLAQGYIPFARGANRYTRLA